MEQGSHKELLARDGFFAAMWADQISASDDHAGSIATRSIGDVKQELAGYSVEASEQPEPAREEEPVALETAEDAEPSELPSEAPLEVAVEDVPPTDNTLTAEQVEQLEAATQEPEVAEPAPVAFPATEAEEEPVPAEPVSSAPLAFPTSDEVTPPPSQPQSPPPTPGVTFESGNPPRTGTPDPDSEPKRKRISSQNFQRLARRISITTRRQGSMSSIIPGLKRSDSPKVSSDDATGGGEGSRRNSNDSPTPSISGDSKSKKKDKKDKKKKSLI